MPLCLRTYTPEGLVTFASPGLAHLFGYEAAEHLGRPASELATEFTPESYRELLQEVAGQDKAEVEFRARRKDGTTFWARATICPLRRSNQLVGFLEVCRDVSEEEWLESARVYAELDTRLKEATALARVGRTITREMELDRLLHLILDSLQQTFHFHSSGILFLDEAKNELYIRVARGYELIDRNQLRLGVGKAGITGHAAGLRQTVYVPDVLLDARYVPGSADVRSELALPLVVGDRLLGVLDVQDSRIDAFSPAAIRVLT